MNQALINKAEMSQTTTMDQVKVQTTNKMEIMREGKMGTTPTIKGTTIVTIMMTTMGTIMETQTKISHKTIHREISQMAIQEMTSPKATNQETAKTKRTKTQAIAITTMMTRIQSKK